MQLTHDEIDTLLSALDGKRDKHVLALARNYEMKHRFRPPPALDANHRQIRLFRAHLATRREMRPKVPFYKAEHILTQKGRYLADVINDRETLALSIPTLRQALYREGAMQIDDVVTSDGKCGKSVEIAGSAKSSKSARISDADGDEFP